MAKERSHIQTVRSSLQNAEGTMQWIAKDVVVQQTAIIHPKKNGSSQRPTINVAKYKEHHVITDDNEKNLCRMVIFISHIG